MTRGLGIYTDLRKYFTPLKSYMLLKEIMPDLPFNNEQIEKARLKTKGGYKKWTATRKM